MPPDQLLLASWPALGELLGDLKALRPGEAASPRVQDRLRQVLGSVGASLASRSAEERRSCRERILEELNPLVGSSGLLLVVRERSLAGARNFRVLRRAQQNRPRGCGPAAQAFDRFLLSTHALSALRARRHFFRRELCYRFRRAPLDRPFRVLSYGSGPGQELIEFLRDIGPAAGRLEATLLDGDADSLRHARAQADRTGNGACLMTRRTDPVRAALLGEDQRLAGQDFVYAPCLFDFLPDEVAAACMSFIYRLLSERGQFFLAHYHRDLTIVDRTVLEWWLEWYPYFRTPRGVAKLLQWSVKDRGCAVGLVRGPNVYLVVGRASSRTGGGSIQ